MSDAFTVDDAKEFIQGIQEDIKKYALRLLGKTNEFGFHRR